ITLNDKRWLAILVRLAELDGNQMVPMQCRRAVCAVCALLFALYARCCLRCMRAAVCAVCALLFALYARCCLRCMRAAVWWSRRQPPDAGALLVCSLRCMRATVGHRRLT
ncbi:hypothetical protein JYU34_017575, partial [Plutella xylostella]